MRRAYFIDKKSLRQIAEELGVARKSVRKAIESAEAETYKLSTPRPAPILGPYKGRIDALLAENEQLPPKQRYTSHKVFDSLPPECWGIMWRTIPSTQEGINGRIDTGWSILPE
jgi:DNA-binding transcriptional MocR family regulator